MHVLGIDCKAYRLTTGTRAAWPATGAPSNLAEMTNIRDVTRNMTKTKADVTTRASNGWRQNVAVLKEASIEFESVYDTEDTHFVALSDSFMSQGTEPVAIAFLDGDKATEGTKGLWADFMVVGMEETEPLEGVRMAKFTIEITRSAVAPEMIEVVEA